MTWRQFVCAICVAAAGLTLMPATVMAQAQSSGFSGLVKDASGAVMPGVTVEASSPALIEKVRVGVTDGQGLYRIEGLPGGVYNVEFTLPGFNTVRQEGIELPNQFTATINAQLTVGSLEETIIVTGAAPTIDLRNVQTGTVVSKDLLEALPVNRAALSGFAPTLPGVEGGLGRLSVQASSMTIHGSVGSDANLTVDGFSIRAANTMMTAYYPNQQAAQEITMVTEGNSADQQLSSVWVNIIPKEGGNQFTGSAYGQYTTEGWQADNLSQELIDIGVSSADAMKLQWEGAVDIGGPLKQDKLWFFLAYRQDPVEQYLANNYYSKDPAAWVYEPDLTRPATIKIRDYSSEARISWLPTPRNKFSFSYTYNAHVTEQRGFSSLRTPEATSYAPYDPGNMVTATWRSPLNNRLLLEAGVGERSENLDNRRQWIGMPGDLPIPFDRVRVVDQDTGRAYRAGQYSDSAQHIYMGRASATYVTGAHSFKVGMGIHRAWSKSNNEINGEMQVQTRNNRPSAVTLYASPDEDIALTNPDLGIFAQDQWTMARLTLNYGIRYDLTRAETLEQDLVAGRFVPARHFDAVKRTPDFQDIGPRLGAVWDIFGTGKTALKFSHGRYVNFESTSVAFANSQQAATVQSATRSWADANGDWELDCDFNNTAANRECGPLSNLNFGKVNPTNVVWDPDVMRGWGVRPYQWSSSILLQHEIMQGISANVGYYRRRFHNFRVTDNLDVTPADYGTYCVTAPVDPRLPSGGGYQVCGFADTLIRTTKNFITSAETYGEQTQAYDGFDFTTTVRRYGAQLSGGVNIGRTQTNNCFVVDSPGQLVNCEVKPPMRPNIKFSGVYQLPWYSVQLSFTYSNLPGPEILANRTYTNAEILPSLKRNLASGVNGTVTLPLISPGTLFGDRRNTTNLRISKSMNLPNGVRLQGNLQVQNLFNDASIQIPNPTYGSLWQLPSGTAGGIVQARYFEVSGTFSF